MFTVGKTQPQSIPVYFLSVTNRKARFSRGGRRRLSTSNASASFGKEECGACAPASVRTERRVGPGKPFFFFLNEKGYPLLKAIEADSSWRRNCILFPASSR